MFVDVNPESTPPTSAITSPITPRTSRKGNSVYAKKVVLKVVSFVSLKVFSAWSTWL